MSKKYVKIDPKDNLVVAMENLPKGTVATVDGVEVTLQNDIKIKHKFALHDYQVGDQLFMYGVLIGKAVLPIKQGEIITTDNVKHASSLYADQKVDYQWQKPDLTNFEGRTFNGYHRADGRVGTANHWLIIPLTFCENRNVEVLEAALVDALGYQSSKDFAVDTQSLVDRYKNGATSEELLATDIISSREDIIKNRLFPNVDGIKFLKHDGGCGGIRQDSQTLCRLLAGYISSPNVAGATVFSLGCQNAQIQMLEDALDQFDPERTKPVTYFEQQRSAGERQFIQDAVKSTFVGLIEANKISRKPAPLSKLVMGLECGGSDGFSGISANPSLGYASDLLAALGGTPVLSEFPELNGVEQEIINRCNTTEDAKKFSKIMRSYSDAAIAVGSGFENNPSPGNIKDGLITDAMKSAGAAKKGGTSPVVQVLDYTEQITKPGLNLLCTPGNDVESTTGLIGSGCNVVVFTTGLGTPTGNPVAPVLKMSSNTAMYERMEDIIDINAGTVITGQDSIKTMGEKILNHVISVASGEVPAKATVNGHNDFIPWKRGISL